ncbi:MAG: NYN domain-containing protein [Hylemonella sp.]|nr:NYN domain-containing protein [Hylemonella sp.]MDP1938125.1 NYN domain-containing protein [Hylemonella sp.]
MTPNSTLVFVDGENLSLRYKEMLAMGRTPRPDNIYVEDCFIWNQRILDDHIWNIKRIGYYTSTVGDDHHVRAVREKIAATTFTCTTEDSPEQRHVRTGQIVPFVRKKAAKSKKESICDIAIAVDVMRACYRDHAETIWLLSGDGDFIQLIQEVVHSGKCAYASAFSSGFNEDIRFVVDEFSSLDKYFFLTEEEIKEKERVAAARAAVPRVEEK